MLNIKVLLNKVANWINGWGADIIEKQINNTTDTWVPVWGSASDGSGKTAIQHRVIPSDAYATATKTNSTAWTGGSIQIWRKGNCCTVKFEGVVHPQITSRTTIGTIPEGFRPPMQLEILMTNTNSSGGVSSACKFLVNDNGTIQIDPTNAGSTWATITYCV